MKIKKTNIDYFNLILALALSGNQALTSKQFYEPLLILYAMYLTLFYIKITSKHLNKFLLVLLPFIAVFTVQIISFNKLNIISYLGFLVKLYIGFILFNSIKNAPEIYIKALKHLALLSFIFYIPSLFYPNFHSFFSLLANIVGVTSEYRINIGLHNFTGNRNSGFFWEPGAFAGYLILAIIFQLVLSNKNSSKIDTKDFLILVSGVISTLSTTGFIALTVLIFIYLKDNLISVKSTLSKIFIILLIPVTSFLIIHSFEQYDFLSSKITSQYESAINKDYGWQINRIGTFLFDLEYIKDRPLTGWGFHSSTRFSKNPADADLASGMGNGMSDYVAKTGILIFLLFCYRIFKWVRSQKINKIQSLIILFTIILLLQGEVFLGFPIFLGLYFLPKTNLQNESFSLPSYMPQPQS